MISNVTIYGMAAAMAVSFLIPVACTVYCAKKAVGIKGTPMVLLLGLMGSMITNNLAGIILGRINVNNLLDFSFILYSLVIAVTIAVIDSGMRLFTIQYTSKGGIGLHKGMLLGAGFALGQVFIQAINYFQVIGNSVLINDGTFIDSMMEQAAVTGDEAVTYQASLVAYQNNLLSVHPGTYYVTALEQGATVFLHIALGLILVKFFLDHKKIVGTLIVVGIRLLTETISRLVYYTNTEYTNYAASEVVSLVLSAVVAIAIGAGSIYCILKLMKLIPEEKKEAAVTKKDVKAMDQKKKENKAWQEVNNLNTRNIAKDVNTSNQNADSVSNESIDNDSDDTESDDTESND